jgi:prolyl-tRNA editing enzyme YbaK/EbsC (Cys-tRNA(Pro) deacylase)
MTIDQPIPERSQIVQQHLDKAGLPGRVRELPDSTRTAADAASALGCEVGAIASSLLFLADDEPVLVMTSGRHRVDTDQLARYLGAASVTMAPAALVREVTGQAIGGVSPVGHPTRVRTVVDEALQDYEVIWAAGGTPHTVFPLTFADLVAITGGTPIRIAED